MGLTVNQSMYFLHLGLHWWGKPFNDLGLYETLLCVLFTIYPCLAFSRGVKNCGGFWGGVGGENI